jgi:hypothetical protein
MSDRAGEARGTSCPPDDVLHEALQRIAGPGWERFSAQLRHTGGCARPVKLKGSVRRADAETGEVLGEYNSADDPDGVLLKACQARRATRCPACAWVYKADARQLILAGLIGGKGVGPEVRERPLAFVTLTAPSFGAVHTRHPDEAPCHREKHPCACGQSHQCDQQHGAEDPQLGKPICSATYDYAGAVIWNNRCGELWRRTMINASRSLARYLGIPQRSFNRTHRLAYLKVIEYQSRGVVHVHGLVRLDAVAEVISTGAPLDTGRLVAAIARAAAVTAAPSPLPNGPPVRWGPQNRVDPVPVEGRQPLSSYLAKYTTKSVYAGGALDHRLVRGELSMLDIDDHLKRLVQAAWDLGAQRSLRDYRLRQWAHTLGYRGHWMTKSLTWSTTLTALRQARFTYQAQRAGEEPDSVSIAQWAYRGNGHTSEGDAWLAEVYRRNRQLNRRTRWEEQ